VELLYSSINETVKFPDVVDLVFIWSITGALIDVNTFTESNIVIASPVGFETLMYKVYDFPTNGIDGFPVLDMVN
jgi:hypothetical protein